MTPTESALCVLLNWAAGPAPRRVRAAVDESNGASERHGLEME